MSSKLNKYTKQDEIIAYIQSGEKGTLSPDLVELLDIYSYIHALRKRYLQIKQIVEMLLYKYNTGTHKMSKSKAYRMINECEYIFPKIEKFNVEYERLWLAEVSRKNISMAIASGKPDSVTKAALAHVVIAGLNKDNSEIPDFSKLEAHTYNLVIPPQMEEFIIKLMNAGSVDLSSVLPEIPKMIDIKANEE